MRKGGDRLEKKETYNEEQKAQVQIRELGSRLKSLREVPQIYWATEVTE